MSSQFSNRPPVLVRLGHLVAGLGVLVLVVALVVGVPWALWHFVGWPLPHHVPSAAQVGRALSHQGLPDQVLIDILAVGVWCSWAVLVASLAVEVPAAVSGRRARRLPLGGLFQPAAARLVAVVLLAVLALAPRTPASSAGPSLGGHLSGAAVRPAAVTMVLADAVQPVSAATPAAAVSTAVPAAVPSTAPTPTTYVVQRGDTLWGIAERECGNPLEWSAIFALNEGRPQPDGATLTDPHWIDPGWTLLLPAQNPPSAPPPPPAAPAPPPPAPAVAPVAPVPITAPTIPPADHHLANDTPTPAGRAGAGDAAHDPPAPVRLPSGSVVGGAFVAGLLSAVALGRLRRRHAYRYHPPEPGRATGSDPLRPTLRHLAAAQRGQADRDQPGRDQPAPDRPAGMPPIVPRAADDDPEHRECPELIEVGTREGRPVELALSELGAVAVTGSEAAPVVAAWITALLVRAGPLGAEVVTTPEALARLVGEAAVPALAEVPGLRVVADADGARRLLDAEVLARSRRLAEAEATDVVALRRANPWEPVPMVLAVLDRLDRQEVGRWATVTAAGPQVGVATVILDGGADLTAHLELDPGRVVVSGAPESLAARLLGVALFGLAASEAADVLATLAEAEARPDSTEDEGDAREGPAPPIRPERREGVAGTSPTPDDGGEAWPAPVGAGTAAPSVAVRLLGPLEVSVGGEVVATGLRGPAKELLAWLCCNPQGASIEAVVEALWPDTDPDQVSKRFWRAGGNLRTRLGARVEPESKVPESKVLVQVGPVYRLDPAAVGCDLWAFQAALAAATRADDDRVARDALRRATDAYRGELLAGADYPWVEPVRQDLHRRATDAQLRLAELEDRLRAPEAAEAALAQAIEHDRYAEEPYRRLMALQAEHGRLDAVTATWRLLERRLAEIDVDPEDATVRLYRRLTEPERPAAPGRRLGAVR